MRLNENTKIIGDRVILVPYEEKHVEKYHEWMKSPDLQTLTASEPLSIEEEYKMQKSWRNDEDKCTFLVLNRELYETNGFNEIDSLIGDTNLFLTIDDDDDETQEKIAEAEIMIAEQSARGKGCGWEAMLLMFKYSQVNLGIQKFIAKIGYDNTKSLRMFEKMHFKEASRSDIFREVTLNCIVTSEWVRWLDDQVTLRCENYAA